MKWHLSILPLLLAFSFMVGASSFAGNADNQTTHYIPHFSKSNRHSSQHTWGENVFVDNTEEDIHDFVPAFPEIREFTFAGPFYFVDDTFNVPAGIRNVREKRFILFRSILI